MALGASASLALGAWTCAPRSEPNSAPRKAATAAVDLTLESLQGKTLSLSSFRGKPLVILFFTTWCVPCQVMGARLLPIRAALGDHRMSILGISLDTEHRLVPVFVEAAGFSFPVAYGDPAMVKWSALGAVKDVPRIVILDRQGRPVADFYGPAEARSIARALKPLL